MNSVIQCLSNLENFTNFFLSQKRHELIYNHMECCNIKEDSLLYKVYKDLIDNLWKGVPNQPFSPIQFKARLEQLNPLFIENKYKDPSHFLIYLIKKLHDELNNIEYNPNITSGIVNINVDNNYVNPFDQRQVFENFLRDFTIKHHSIISGYFFGVSQSLFECQRCKFEQGKNTNNSSSIRYEYETFYYLEFP